MIVVSAAIIHRNDKILISQRLEGSYLEFLWEFPGGKVEEGESPEECIIREIMEELRINIRVINIFDVVFHKYEDRTILLLVYDCEYISGEPKPIECNTFNWVTAEELSSYKFTCADEKVVKKMTKCV
jgi:8-oxo-dGTP diphosphatase